MPVSKPKPNEPEQDFVSRVIPELVNAGKKKDEAAAIAYSTYRDVKKARKSITKAAGQGVIDPEQLRIGTKIEMDEHHETLEGGMKIALDHLREHADYYTRLKDAGL